MLCSQKSMPDFNDASRYDKPMESRNSKVQVVKCFRNENARTIHRARSAIAFAVIIAGLAGCAVSPRPIEQAEIDEQLAEDMTVLPARGQQLEGTVDLERALVHALVHNHGLRLQMLETALSRREVGTTALGMLPQLMADAGYNERNDYDASTSVVLIDGEPDALPGQPAYSVSSGLETRTRGVTFTWNLLDFGLSYVRAQQSADRHLIEAERERRAIHTITAEVRAAYWKAVSAERLLPQIGPLIADAEAALNDVRSLEQDRSVPPRLALEDQRRMLDVLRLLQDLQADLVGAKVELADLMGLHPAAEFELTDARSLRLHVPHLRTPIETLELVALQSRPEMREAHYQARVSTNETRAALMALLPGLQLTRSGSYEDNIYLRQQNWQTLGASVNVNLFNIFAIAPIERRGEARRELVDQQRLATAMSVLAQVHISAAEFAESREAYRLSAVYLDVSRRIVAQADAQVATNSTGSQDLIRERLNSILAELRRDRAYAAVQNSFGRVLASSGIDLFPMNYRELDVPTLMAVLDERMDQISRGDFPLAAPPAQDEEVAEESAPEHGVQETGDEANDDVDGTPVEQDACLRRFLGLCIERGDDHASDVNDHENGEAVSTGTLEVETLPTDPTP